MAVKKIVIKEEHEQLISKVGTALELVAQDLEQIELAMDNSATPQELDALEDGLAQYKDVFLRVIKQKHLFPNIHAWDFDDYEDL